MPAVKKVTLKEPVKCHFCFEKAYEQWDDTAGCPEHAKDAQSRANGEATRKTPKKEEGASAEAKAPTRRRKKTATE